MEQDAANIYDIQPDTIHVKLWNFPHTAHSVVAPIFFSHAVKEVRDPNFTLFLPPSTKYFTKMIYA